MYLPSTQAPVAWRRGALMVGVWCCAAFMVGLIASAEEPVTDDPGVIETETAPVVEIVPEGTSHEGAFIFYTEPITEETVVAEEVLPEVTPEADPVVEEAEVLESDAVPESETELVPETPAPVETEAEIMTPILSTDREEYHPEEVATIFGRFFAKLQHVVVTIFAGSKEEDTYIETVETVTTDEAGSFELQYTLGGLAHAFYTVIASTELGETLAEMIFIDPPSVDFKQCANDNPTAGSCDWIGSILQANNSVYYEGMSVPQRLLYRGLGNGAHTISFDYSYTKGGIHAYDFITGKNQGNADFVPGITAINNCQGLAGPDLTACNALSALSPTMIDVPTDTFDSKDSAPAAGTGSSQAAKEAAYEAMFGNRQISFHTNGTISGANMGAITHSVPANGDTGDSDATATINFTLTGCQQGCNVLVYFDGHLAVGGDDNTTGVHWGPSLGSSAISGGPYHIKGVKLDGDGGSLDNQIKGADVLLPPPETGAITIVKDAVPNGATDFAFTTTGAGLSNFSLDDDADGTLANSITFSDLASGSYAVTELAAAGFLLTSLQCTDSSGGTTVNGATATIDLADGETVTCTFTNTKDATLTLVKEVVNNHGGTAVADDFEANIDGNSVPWGVAQVVSAGAHTASEITLPAYTAGSWGGDCAADGTVILAAGENKTCTITNDDKPGTLIVHKVTNPDTDTATQFSITASADSGLVEGVALQTIAGGETETYTVHTGVYDVTEGAIAGWDETENTCVDVAVTNGEEKHCTITNTKKGYLIVEKTTLPSGDTTSFSITASGSGTITGGGGGFVTDATDKDYEVTPGTYSVEETTPAGWDMTANTCDDVEVMAGDTKTCSITNVQRGSITIVKDAVNNHAQDFTFNNNFGNGHPATFKLDDDGNVTLPNTRTFEVLPGTYAVSEDPVAGWQQESAACSDQSPIGTIAVAPGENVTCTFVNEEYAKIILVKNTQGGNGEFDFDGAGDGLPTDIDLTTVAGTASVTFSDLDQDNTYSITENVPAGWTLISSVCSGTNTPDEITPNPGETVTCTFVNGKLPTLTLEKTVINNYGGTAEADDFTGKINDVAQAWGVAKTLIPGNYTATEIGLFGYSASAWGTDCADEGAVTLAYGENKTCSITNSDIAPKLTVIKHVINDDGGNNVAGDFTMNVTGTQVSNSSFAGSEAGVTVTLDAGAYSVDESIFAGYTKTLGENCLGSIGIGQEKTCTITNDDQPAKITLIKKVISNNGGSAKPDDFGLTIGGNAATSGQTYEVHSNTAHALNEAGLTGYDFVSLTGDAKCPDVLGGTVKLGEGEEVSCTITNDDTPAHLIVIKHVDNGNTGATAEADDFTTTISGVTTAHPVADGAEAPGIDNVLTSVGAYSVDEGPHAGYDKQLSADCSGTIALGQTKICTITNTAIAPKLTVIKVVDNGNTGATYTAVDFQMEVDGDEVPQNVAQTETVGTHTVTETGPAGYTATFSGDCNEDGDVTLALADDKTCTITNTAIAPKLTLIKTVINDHGGQKQVVDFPLSIDATGVTSGVANTVTVGSHTASEVGDAGYTASAWGGDCANNGTVTLALADDKTCTITNNDKPGKLEINKNTIGGNDTFNFTVEGASDSTLSVTTVANTGTTGVFEVNAGAYSATEAAKTSWDLTSASCTNGTPDHFTVANGETVTCTFTNTKRATVTIVKDAVPNDTQDFAFASAVLGTFTLDDDAGVVDTAPGEELGEWSHTKTFANVLPGTVKVTETQPNQYWKLKTASCVETGTQNVVVSTLAGAELTVTAAPGADITCTFVNEKISPTRTQGFWQTHTTFTTSKFTSLFAAGMTIGNGIRKTILTKEQLFGAWYASIPKLTNGKQRTALDKARMTLLQQLVTAKLNCAAFGCTTGVQTMIANAEVAYSGTSASAIMGFVTLVDAYNNSGDTIIIGNAGKATPKTSQNLANKAFWDMP
jgi:hypothetical protein